MEGFSSLSLTLIALGAALMLVCIFKYKKTMSLAGDLLPANEKRIPHLEKLHLFLMLCFFVGYLGVLVLLALDSFAVSGIFVGFIFFFGAVFVLLGIELQKNLLSSIGRQYSEILVKNKQFVQVENATIFTLARQAELRDKETGNHLKRCREFVQILADELALLPKFRSYLTPDYIADIVRASLLHDIGKVGIPDAILLKKGRLDAEEFEIIKTHCELGASILNEAEAKLEFRSFLTIARKITLAHHERWDGKGYPFGMRGEEIPISARIMALADVYDALTSRRCYKSAVSHQETVSIIRQERGKQFDPDVCDAFLRREKEFLEVSKSLTDLSLDQCE